MVVQDVVLVWQPMQVMELPASSWLSGMWLVGLPVALLAL